MAKLIYSMLMSLDGYIADEAGNFDWAVPDEEVHRFVNDLERPIGTYLFGRRMYEVMAAWETMHTVPDQPPFILDYAAIWQAADKVVHSRTLESVSTARTRIERTFDPEAVRRIKARSERDLTVGGPELAAAAFAAWARGRAARVRRAGPDRGRHAGAPRRRPTRARPGGRAPVRQRHGLPASPSALLSARG